MSWGDKVVLECAKRAPEYFSVLFLPLLITLLSTVLVLFVILRRLPPPPVFLMLAQFLQDRVRHEHAQKTEYLDL